jgi:hypothetical protein
MNEREETNGIGAKKSTTNMYGEELVADVASGHGEIVH